MIKRLKSRPGIVPEATSYNDFYELEALGDTYIVSLGTVLTVERELARCATPEGLEFRDVFGASHRLPARCVYRISYCDRSAGLGMGTFNVVAPVPAPFSHEFGGTVPMPRVDGRSAAQNM